MDLPGFVDFVRWTRERYVVAGIQLRSMPITNQEIPMLPVDLPLAYIPQLDRRSTRQTYAGVSCLATELEFLTTNTDNTHKTHSPYRWGKWDDYLQIGLWS